MLPKSTKIFETPLHRWSWRPRSPNPTQTIVKNRTMKANSKSKLVVVQLKMPLPKKTPCKTSLLKATFSAVKSKNQAKIASDAKHSAHSVKHYVVQDSRSVAMGVRPVHVESPHVAYCTTLCCKRIHLLERNKQVKYIHD